MTCWHHWGLEPNMWLSFSVETLILILTILLIIFWRTGNSVNNSSLYFRLLIICDSLQTLKSLTRYYMLCNSFIRLLHTGVRQGFGYITYVVEFTEHAVRNVGYTTFWCRNGVFRFFGVLVYGIQFPSSGKCFNTFGKIVGSFLSSFLLRHVHYCYASGTNI